MKRAFLTLRNTGSFFPLTGTIILSLILSLFLVHCGKREPVPEQLEMRGRTMGTTFMVKVLKPTAMESIPTSELTARLTDEIGKILVKLNQQMSTWIDDSELSRFNRYRENDWFELSADTAGVLTEAQRISDLTGGAFDITVGPLINLWGFGPAKTDRQVPTDEQIQAVKEKTGYHKLSVRVSPPAVKKENPDIHCSLSAIAKGFGVDKVGEYLETRGYDNYLVEIGGEVRARGINLKGTPWRLAISTPDGRANFQKILYLKDAAMATSGDYYNYFEKDGVRYSHTINPVTGKPITHKLASVTVIHDNCMTADALATAINVLGPEEGYQLALKEKLPVFLIIKKGKAFIEKMTPRFEELMKVSETVDR
jgi:FAD:protein FMN transferase